MSGSPREGRVVVLRVDAGAAEWLAAARGRAHDAPQSLNALLRGRSRVELTSAEADSALRWARTVPGWDDDGPPPLFVYDGSEPLTRA
jgi:hypothetical protein